jgi:hypothetical protein
MQPLAVTSHKSPIATCHRDTAENVLDEERQTQRPLLIWQEWQFSKIVICRRIKWPLFENKLLKSFFKISLQL